MLIDFNTITYINSDSLTYS